MVRVEKRRALKRKRTDVDEGSGDDLPTEKKVDKASLKERLASGDYDYSMHFSKRSIIEVEQN